MRINILKRIRAVQVLHVSKFATIIYPDPPPSPLSAKIIKALTPLPHAYVNNNCIAFLAQQINNMLLAY